MTKTRKVFSLLIAIVLVLNVFAVMASADVATGKSVAIIAETSDKLVAGGNIDVNFYFELPEGVDYKTYKLGQFLFPISYDNSVLTPVSRTWNKADYDNLNEGTTFSPSTNTIGKLTKITAEEKAKYPAAVTVGSGTWDPANGDGVTTASGFSLKASKALIFTVRFKVSDSYAGGSTSLGVLASTFAADKACYLKTITDAKNTAVAKSGKYLTSVIDMQTMLTIEEASSYKVFDGDVKIRRNAADSAKYDLGFTGSFKKSDFPVVFTDAGTATNLTQVGVKVTMNGVTNEYTDRFVYETADGYQFRAVLAGLEDSMADTEISVVMFIVFDGVRYESKGLTTTLGAHTGRLPA